MKKRILIVGGGISGLSLAYRLTELSHEAGISLEIQLLEASGRLGGVIQTEHQDSFLMEAGPDSFITEKPQALELCRRLEIQEELINTNQKNRRSFIFRNGKLWPVPEGFYLMTPSRLRPFLASTILSPAGKLRVLLEPLVSRLPKNKSDESVGSFVRRRFGQEALDDIAQPMMAGIFMSDPYHLSLKATFPKFLELEHKYGTVLGGMLWQRTRLRDSETASGPRYSMFTSLRQGMNQLVEQLVAQLPDVKFQLNSRISKVERAGTWRVTLDSEEVLETDFLCLAIPAFSAGRLLETVHEELAEELKAIRYESVVSVNVVFRKEYIDRELNGFGFVVPYNQNRKIIACSFSSVKFEGRASEDYVLLRVFLVGVFQPYIHHLPDEMIERTVIEELSDILGIHEKPEIIVIHRHDHSMPQYAVGHLERVERIEEKVKSLEYFYLTGNGYRGMGIPDCIKYSENVAEQIMQKIKCIPSSPQEAAAE